MKNSLWLLTALLLSPIAQAQQNLDLLPGPLAPIEKVQPAGTVRNVFLSTPLGISREVTAAARDFATFHDPQWSILTLGQIGAGTADLVTSLNNFHACPSCRETGLSRLFVGTYPDAHKYIIAGILEISVEAVTAHYFRNHGPARKWYWRTLWTLPQSLSLYEHARAANHNAGMNLPCTSRNGR